MAVLFYCAGKVKFVEVEKELNKKQIGKRLLQVLIVLFGISFLTFGLTYLSPGDPAEIMLTECGNLPTPELLAKTRAELGLDKPFLVQYGNWLKPKFFQNYPLGLKSSKKGVLFWKSGKIGLAFFAGV